MEGYKIGQEMTITWCPPNWKYVGKHAVIVEDTTFKPSDKWTDKAWITENPAYFEYRHLFWQRIKIKGDAGDIIFPAAWMIPENEKHPLTP
jgi:hypothetical protein